MFKPAAAAGYKPAPQLGRQIAVYLFFTPQTFPSHKWRRGTPKRRISLVIRLIVMPCNERGACVFSSSKVHWLITM